MIVYRGTHSVWPQDLDHKRLCLGFFGSATYFAVDESDAQHYAQNTGSNIQIVTTYSIPLDNYLTISSKDWIQVNQIESGPVKFNISNQLQEKLDYQLNQIEAGSLATIIRQTNYQAAILTGQVEGGEQVVLPVNEIKVQVLNYNIKIKVSHLTQSSELINALTKECINNIIKSGYLIFNCSPVQIKSLESLLK